KHLLRLKGNTLTVESTESESIINEISKINSHDFEPSVEADIKCKFNKEEYIETINLLKAQISTGNIYETNFCIEFFDESAEIDLVQVYENLSKNSPTPFSN